MTYTLTIPPFSGSVSERVVYLPVSGLSLKAGRTYTVVIDYLLTGIDGKVGMVLADKDGRNELGRGEAGGRTQAFTVIRTSFVAARDGSMQTLLRVLMPNGVTNETQGVLKIRSHLVTEGDYTGPHFTGDGRGFGAVTEYQEYAWADQEQRSESIQYNVVVTSSVQKLRENWRKLRSLLWTPRHQVELTKRWRDEDGIIRKATALAQYAGGLEPKMTGRGDRAEFQVDMKLTDPFFYADEMEVIILQPGANSVTILGDYPSRRMFIEIGGISWTNFSVTSGPYNLQATRVDAGIMPTILIDVENFRAIRYSIPESWAYHTPHVTHKGAKEFFVLDPGERTIQVNWVGPPGTVKISYYPAYL